MPSGTSSAVSAAVEKRSSERAGISFIYDARPIYSAPHSNGYTSRPVDNPSWPVANETQFSASYLSPRRLLSLSPPPLFLLSMYVCVCTGWRSDVASSNR